MSWGAGATGLGLTAFVSTASFRRLDELGRGTDLVGGPGTEYAH